MKKKHDLFDCIVEGIGDQFLVSKQVMQRTLPEEGGKQDS